MKTPKSMSPFVQAFAHVLGVAAVQGKSQQRVGALQLGDDAGDELHRGGLAAADAHLAGERLVGDADLGLGAAHEVDDLLRAAAQAHAGGGELDVAAATVEEPHAELVLEVLHLARERGLREMERVRGARDGALARDHKKVLQMAKLHAGLSIGWCSELNIHPRCMRRGYGW